VRCVDWSFWELVQAPCRPNNPLLSDETSKCLRLDAFCDEVLETEHTSGSKEAKSALFLRRQHRDKTAANNSKSMGFLTIIPGAAPMHGHHMVSTTYK
jgi:hypothetical protein